MSAAPKLTGDAPPIPDKLREAMERDPELRNAHARCCAAGAFPVIAEELQRLISLDREVEHLRAVGKAYQETAVERAEHIRELEAAVASAPDTELVLSIFARIVREVPERVTARAIVADIEAQWPGFEERVGEHLRSGR